MAIPIWKQRNNMGRNSKIKQSQKYFWLDYRIECWLYIHTTQMYGIFQMSY